jgi:hypothetical protein
MGNYWEYGPPPALPNIDALATYNAEKARGIVHTREWDLRMAELQLYFNSNVATPAVWIEKTTARRRNPFNIFRRNR